MPDRKTISGLVEIAEDCSNFNLLLLLQLANYFSALRAVVKLSKAAWKSIVLVVENRFMFAERREENKLQAYRYV